MVDETRHARLAFGLARIYRGAELGPGPMAIDRALHGTDVARLVQTTFVEGCVGETLAALECAEAAGSARPAVIRSVLTTLAADESRHAEHAWRVMAWALATFGERARSVLQAEIVRLGTEPAKSSTTGDADERWITTGSSARRPERRSAPAPCTRSSSSTNK